MKKNINFQEQFRRIDYGILFVFILINTIMISSTLIYSSNEKLYILIFDFFVFAFFVASRIIMTRSKFHDDKRRELFKKILTISHSWLVNVERLNTSVNNLQSLMKEFGTDLKSIEKNENDNGFNEKMIDCILGINDSLDKLTSPITELNKGCRDLIEHTKMKQPNSHG
jgi:hypothetical protein